MTEEEKNVPLIDVRKALPLLGRPGPLSRLAHHYFRKILAFDEVERLIGEAMAQDEGPEKRDFFRRLLDLLHIHLEFRGDSKAIPPSGPVVVLSNHPFGGVDAVSLAHLLTNHRKDTRILANQLLADIPPARPWLLAADLLGEKNRAVRKNATVLRRIRSHLEQGGLLMTFPAGVVSHLHLSQRRITDPPWPNHTAALVRRSTATIVPVFFPGRNSLLFQGVGLRTRARRRFRWRWR
ncbi:MAG: 1-acyl-sn-glycerol-3-phosphate acyltransferase [Verrucomicrobiota bacterium]